MSGGPGEREGPPVAMTIAGSDSGGGAGLQADLRTFAALGVFATTAVTTVTAQNTTEVRSVRSLDAAMVVAQVLTVLDDLPVAAVKTGMLGSAAVVTAVTELAAAGRLPHLVVDPVMVASSGAALADADTIAAYHRLLPLADVITPNLLEAATLAGVSAATFDGAHGSLADQCRLARRIGEKTTTLVVVKGGHGSGEQSVDVVWDGDRVYQFERPRLPTRDTHGSGCTFSAAVAAYLASGAAPPEAVRLAGDFVHRAIDGGRHWNLGAGPGPLDQMGWWRRGRVADPIEADEAVHPRL